MDAPIVEEHPHAPCAPGLSCPSQVSDRKAYTTQGSVPNPSRRMGQQRPRGVRAVRHDEVALRVRRLCVAPAGTRLHRMLWYNFNVLILWALFEGWSCDWVLGSDGKSRLALPLRSQALCLPRHPGAGEHCRHTVPRWPREHQASPRMRREGARRPGRVRHDSATGEVTAGQPRSIFPVVDASAGQRSS
jgi:hypothetical protein